MVTDFKKDYLPLVDAAKAMGIAYSTAYQYCSMNLLPGAELLRGTRWLVPIKTIEKWNNGEINIKGAFGKGNRASSDPDSE